ncbi:MAG: acetoin utilization protein AcuC [Thiohalomonadales bacterium]
MLFLYRGPELAAYGFGQDHPFGPDRHDAFMEEFERQGLHVSTGLELRDPHSCSIETLCHFHTDVYVEKVRSLSKFGLGFLDQGDTPAVQGIFESASFVVGSVVNAVDSIMRDECTQAFLPIGGLHHARRDSAAGFCVFNDIGVAIERLYHKYHLQRIAYVDIDAHHGDGVYYAYESDARLCFVDFHQDGRTLYPGTGSVEETGKGAARGCKLNVPLPPEATDQTLDKFWSTAEGFIDKFEPELIIFQCGADSLAGDPITQLRLSATSHAMVANRLKTLANKHCQGRLLALGGGGYNRSNLGLAWCAVVTELLRD